MSNEILYKLLKLFIILLGFLPRSVAKFCSDIIGLVWFKADKRHKDITLKNISNAYKEELSPDQVSNLSKQVFKNTVHMIFDIAWAFRMDQKELLKHYTIKGYENLKNALQKGRGVLLLAGHMGNFELLVAVFGNDPDFKLYAAYRKFDFQPLERLMLEERQRFGTTMIPLKGAAKKIDAILRNKNAVGTLLDQNADWYNGVFVNYFGRPACTNKGMAILAMRNKALVVPLYIAKTNNTYVVEFLPEIPLQSTGDTIKDIENNTQNYTIAIELMVRKYPDQYFWVHNRWKTRPYSITPRK
ncbi:MAG: lysophospholipid acyltransferase family protein [Desulfobacula sp.]|nr:lysophospholipid acyltransferase family protein [Desulfobacula sp.]